MMKRAQAAMAEMPFDWLGAILLSWLIPLGLAGHLWRLTYRVSLWFWIVPVVLLLPRFLSRTRRGDASRKALFWTSIYIIVGGSVLDFLFGARILMFDPNGDYLFWLPAVGPDARIPVEEILFYIFGGIAIVLAYFWAADFWLERYRPPATLPPQNRIFVLSPPTVMTGVALLVAGFVWAWILRGAFHVPLYYLFLVGAAFVPASALYRSVGELVNWRAFSWTVLWVLLTSAIWEVTLALPRKWWGYRDEAMIGEYIDAWQLREWKYPVEALMVWLVVTFSCVLTYEAVKAYHSDDRTPKERLFG
jgi:hypothetical protein